MEDMDLIDWDNLGAAMERLKLQVKVQLVKFMHNWLNTIKQKQRFYRDAIADCTVCTAKNDTWTYLFQCDHDDVVVIGSLAITNFKAELMKLCIAPIIKQVLTYKVLLWCQHPLVDVPQVPDDESGQVI
eukprot:109756-Ditylum_brightwellii.AAC.1